jgi:S-adenosylmethionine:tRNA ribosyltransferase-isomerase
MHEEWFEIPAAAARALNAVRAGGGAVWAVGTTSCRALESAASADGSLPAGGVTGETRLFIRPGYRFTLVDHLLTNFHLPRSTLLVLVAAFAGREALLSAYRHAVAAGYRFYSYGDCMLIR